MPPSWSIVSPARSASRRQLVKIRQPPAAGQCSSSSGSRSASRWARFTVQDPAPRSASGWPRSAAQLAAFFVLGPQHIGSFYAGPDRENLKKSPRPAVVQTLARAMFHTNIYVKNRTMFHVKQCTINRQKTEFLLTAQKPCILCT